MEKFNSQSVEALGLLKLIMVTAGNSRSTITAYLREIRYLCGDFPDLSPDEWSDRHIIQYMAYLRTVHHASYSKCKMTAQSVAFFFRHVLKRPYDMPSKLYPKREYKLPHYLTKDEVLKLIESWLKPFGTITEHRNKNPNVICLKVKRWEILFTVGVSGTVLQWPTNMRVYLQKGIRSMPSAIASRPTCPTPGLTFIPSKSCWVIAI